MRAEAASREEDVAKGPSSQQRESNHEGWSSYSPFNCFQMATRAFLKCLGLDSSSTSDQINTTTQTSSRANDEDDRSRGYLRTVSTQSVSVVEQDPAPSTASDEQGMKNSEDVTAAKSSVFMTLLSRPPKPPISSGRGGQHH